MNRILEPGMYRVKVVDVTEKQSRSGRIVIDLELEEFQSKQKLHIYIQTETPSLNYWLFQKMNLSNQEMITEEELMGKEFEVFIDKKEYRNTVYNNVSVKYNEQNQSS